ncbi:DUF4040 domain-containing protein [Alteromonas sp. ASW11-130]|uniref:DUF4040 domain-containing protein n=1 Tax=Alteromonas sp. ASW11-130 TaxID=3015775 RepID=UPI002241E02B|nr:DUF4040 domain-containing protein [Alteromonas sp. ASW11-130]MCW8092758.1 DUF4040 domain-containing protein [Alteromonas sp. ASW11-130]
MLALTVDIFLLVFLIASAVGILFTHQLFAMAMLFGLYSLLVASLFILLDAPDVAFTEAAVGTGIATVLMLATLAATKESKEKPRKKLSKSALTISIFTGALLLYGTTGLPKFGDPEAPIHTQMADRFIQQGQAETGVPNLVTAVLASYRGFDTLGEVTVVFTAGVGVLLLLRRRYKPKIRRNADAG